MDHQNPHHSRLDIESFVSRWLSLTRELGDLVAWLWRAWPVDLMFVVFSGTDSINHRTRDIEQIALVYRSTDEALGSILDVVGDRTLVALVSDHGSTPAHRYIALHRALHQAGWQSFRPEVAKRLFRRLLPGPLGEATREAWLRLPTWARRALSWPLLSLDGRLAIEYENLDWTRTKVFGRSGMGPLYINLEGRRPDWCVPLEEYEDLREELIQCFLKFQDQDGRPLFRSAQRREAVYPGARDEDDPPDVVFEPANWSDHVITGYPSDPLVRPIPPDREYGTHTPDGIFALAGPGVRQGVDLGTVRIFDLVPTLLTIWDLAVPEDCEGRVLREAFELPLRERRLADAATEERSWTVEHSDEVMHRLRSLGYVD